MAPSGAAAAAGEAELPDKCFESGPNFELPTCTNTGNGWEVSYEDSFAGPGFPSWFVALFVLVLIVGIGTTIWRVWFVRDMATRAGMNPNQATAVSMLGQDGVTATYLAASMRGTRPGPDPDPRSATTRLEELEQLKARGLVTMTEYEERRRIILESI
jgi:hypothetical protein